MALAAVPLLDMMRKHRVLLATGILDQLLGWHEDEGEEKIDGRTNIIKRHYITPIYTLQV